LSPVAASGKYDKPVGRELPGDGGADEVSSANHRDGCISPLQFTSLSYPPIWYMDARGLS
jgi:hypothetical protein